MAKGRPPIAARVLRHQLGRVAPLTVRAEPGGCLPGTLECVCGTTDLCIWDPKLGALCDYCHRCWGFPPQGAPKAKVPDCSRPLHDDGDPGRCGADGLAPSATPRERAS